MGAYLANDEVPLAELAYRFVLTVLNFIQLERFFQSNMLVYPGS